MQFVECDAESGLEFCKGIKPVQGIGISKSLTPPKAFDIPACNHRITYPMCELPWCAPPDDGPWCTVP